MSTKEPSSTDDAWEVESPFLEQELFVVESEDEWEPHAAALAAQSPLVNALARPQREEPAPPWEHETPEGVRKKLKLLSLLPHSGVLGGTDVPLTPSLMNPGIYDGPVKYKISDPLQKCLNAVMNKQEFRHIKVALVDLTKGVSQPEFAGFFHKQQVPVANISKIAAMLAAFQLRRDLRVALRNKGAKTLNELFAAIRDDWAATQLDVRAPAQSFTSTITRRRDLVLLKGATVQLTDPKSPHLERLFGAVPTGDPVVVEFSTTGQDQTRLEQLADDFRDGKPDSQKNLDELGFRERLRMMMMDRIRASNHAASTIVADLGHLYIASTLLQSGLFDPARGGGLWIASNFVGKKWLAGVAIGGEASATAASVAVFLILLMQDQLVDRDASAEMRDLLTEGVSLIVTSRSRRGLERLPNEGSIVTLLSSGGVLPPGMDDCAVIERQLDTPGKDVIHYIAVGLRSRKSAEWPSLIVELDNCIRANNSPTPSSEVEQTFP